MALLAGCAERPVTFVGDAGLTTSDVAAPADRAAEDAVRDVTVAAPVTQATPDVSPGDSGEAGCVPEGERKLTPMADGYVGSVEEFAAVMFNSNPPSSGPHCREPGRYSAYTTQPLPRCNYLENLARGAVVLTYNCPQGCDDVVRLLGRSLIGVVDPDCPGVRVVITADPQLDTRVAAAAWGYTWKSDCFDESTRASLTKFIRDHLGSAGEAPRRVPVMCQ
jgi:hypothetical protein